MASRAPPPPPTGEDSPASAFRFRAAVGQAEIHRLPESAEIAGIVVAESKKKTMSAMDSTEKEYDAKSLAQLLEVMSSDESCDKQSIRYITIENFNKVWTQLCASSGSTSPMDKKILVDMERKLVALLGSRQYIVLASRAKELVSNIAINLVERKKDPANESLKSLQTEFWDGNAVWITALRRLVETVFKK